MVLGITGGSGAGKSTLLNALETRGWTVIDCDAVYHALLRENAAMLGELENAFPSALEDFEDFEEQAGGTRRLNRKKLGATVFADAAALAKLNQITHRYVGEEVERIISRANVNNNANNSANVAIDAIALFESGLAAKCDRTIAVISPREVRVKRIMRRDDVTREYAEARINAQPSDDFYIKHADVVVEN